MICLLLDLVITKNLCVCVVADSKHYDIVLQWMSKLWYDYSTLVHWETWRLAQQVQAYAWYVLRRNNALNLVLFNLQ